MTFKINDLFLFFLGAGLCLALTMVHIGLVYHYTEIGISQNYFELRNLIEVVLSNIVLSFLEELFFRVFIFISLLKIFRKFWLALIVSSLLFALMHLNGLDNQFIGIGLVHIFIGGCILTYLYYITNSIWSAIGFHSFNNIMNAVIYSPDDIMNFTVNTLLYLTLFTTLVYFGNRLKDGNRFRILSV